MATEHHDARSAPSTVSGRMAERVVCLFIPHLAVGGSERQLFLLARSLPQTGYRPIVVTMEVGEGAIEPFHQAGIPVRVLRRRGGLGLDVVLRLRAIIRESGAELVHAWLFAANWRSAMLKVLGCRMPVVLSVRSMENNLRGRHNLIYRVVAPLSDAIMTNSAVVARHHARRTGTPRQKYNVIPNGIDVEALERESLEELGRLRDVRGGPVIGFVGRLVDRKRVDSIIRIAPGIVSQCPDARFLVVGDGPSREGLEAQARALGVRDRFLFVGSCPRVGPYLRRMNVFISPGYGEGASNALLEAMALGVPVVAVASDGNSETVQPGVSGLLVPDLDERELGAAVIRLVKDRELGLRLSGEARDRVRREHSVEAMARRTADLYARLISRASR